MPTLRPQTLSGLLVIPTVESGGGIHRVSIGIDVGSSRAGSPAPVVINREDPLVELRAPVEGSLEPIASPDPGPLPVRALRVVQARGEFTFSPGVNAPTELVVALRNDRKTFPMSQTFAATGCPSKEPEEGGRFASAPVLAPGLATPRGLLQRLPQLIAPLRPRCCPGRFDAPLNPIADAAVKSEEFEMQAAFSARGRRCRCTCCEYRQFV